MKEKVIKKTTLTKKSYPHLENPPLTDGEKLRLEVRKTGLIQDEFADKMGVTRTYFSRLCSRTTLTEKAKAKTAQFLQKTVEEVYGNHNTLQEPLVKYGNQTTGIPVYDIVSLAGKGSSETQLTGNISHYINIPGYEDCIGIPAYGLSMYPLLDSGGIGICKQQQDKNHIMYGQVYSIDYKGTQFYKFLQKSTDKTKLLCISLNHDPTRPDCNFEPFEINRDDIDALYLLRLAVNKH